jgi:GDPmannose 4,6-dehydratase
MLRKDIYFDDNLFRMTTYKVFITGISGFIGSYLARQLIEAGNEVVGLLRSRSDGQKPKRLKNMDIIENMHFVRGDITDLTSILSSIQCSEPDLIFHLASQSHVPTSFKDPSTTFRINCFGTQNVLEAVRLKNSKSKIIFAGSSEEYGLQFIHKKHYEDMKNKYGVIEPPPKIFPELPIDEGGSFRPMSPYATSKVYGDYAFRNYHATYGLNTIVSRAFNVEGAGRGHNFVTSTIIRQLVSIHLEQQNIMRIGDIQTFRDWSHIEDIVNGYIILAKHANAGSVYVQGSMRTSSVLSYILYSISMLGYEVNEIFSINNEQKKVKDPLEEAELKMGNIRFTSNIVDQMLLSGALEFNLDDKGLIIKTNKRDFKLEFDSSKFRPSDVPILLSDVSKLKQLGYCTKKGIIDIINDQINYYLDPNNREDIMNTN